MSRLACLLALVLFVPACGGAPDTAQKPASLVLVVVDTLRRDHLGCYGHERPTSPAIDGLAAEGVRFEHAYAAAPWTQPAVASLLTGLHPTAHTVTRLKRGLPEPVVTLAERLAVAGYRTGAVVSHRLLDRTYQFDQGFGSFDNSPIGDYRTISTEPVTDAALRFVDEDDGAFFLLVHYFDPHYAYSEWEAAGFVAAGARRAKPERLNDLRRDLEAIDAEHLQYLLDSYDEEIRRVDAGIERLLAGLAERGLAETTWVALTADHGEEFLERGWLGHTAHLYDETVAVPLVVRPPGGVVGRSVPEPVSMTGLPATLLDLLGLAYEPSEFHVPSFASAVLGTHEAGSLPPVFSEVDFLNFEGGDPRKRARAQALVAWPWKLIVDELAGTRRLYDLSADPGERTDLAADEPERVAELAAGIAARQREARSRAVGTADRRLSQAEVSALLELGYIEDL